MKNLSFHISSYSIALILKGKYKDKCFLCSSPKSRGMVSDLGNLLAYLSAKLGFLNLAMMVQKMKK